MSKSQDATSVNQVYDLMTAVRILTRSSLLFQNAIAEKMGLNVTDGECIDFLMEMGSSTAGDLAKVTRLTTGAITNVIDRLEKVGFVKREKDPKDRRKVIVVLIPERHEKKKKYYEPFANDVFSLFSGYSKKDLKFLITHTSALNIIYQRHMQEIIEEKP
jgi:MarR family transcriptional regulator, organic hydroperoxide resistance regulator